MKLIPMTTFILSGYGELTGVQNMTSVDFRNKVFKYARFLQQPVNLGMFVPCDEEGNVLPSTPTGWGCGHDPDNPMPDECMEEYRIYREAQKKVLFKHFEYCKRDSNILCVVYKDDYHLMLNTIETIEELTRYGFELSDNAVKQIML